MMVELTLIFDMINTERKHMETAENKGQESGKTLEKTWTRQSNDPSEFLKKIQQEKTGTLKESINDIDTFIETRNKLHEEMLLDVESVKSSINNLIAELGREQCKDILIKQIELEIIKVQEKLNRWRDIALLKKELREHMKEIREQEKKENLFDELLDGEMT